MQVFAHFSPLELVSVACCLRAGEAKRSGQAASHRDKTARVGTEMLAPKNLVATRQRATETSSGGDSFGFGRQAARGNLRTHSMIKTSGRTRGLLAQLWVPLSSTVPVSTTSASMTSASTTSPRN